MRYELLKSNRWKTMQCGYRGIYRPGLLQQIYLLVPLDVPWACAVNIYGTLPHDKRLHK